MRKGQIKRKVLQDGVDAAHALLELDSMRQYGLLEGGPTVNIERCYWMLERGKMYGVKPRADATLRLAAALMEG